MVFIRVIFVLWKIVVDSLQFLSSLSRKLLAHAFALPGLLLPDLAILIGRAVSVLYIETHFSPQKATEIAVCVYRTGRLLT